MPEGGTGASGYRLTGVMGRPAKAVGLPALHAADRQFFKGLGRAFGAALMFATPMIMTMEMWAIGFTVPPWRLMLLMLVMVPLVAGLSRFAGIRSSSDWRANVVDGFVAIAVGAVMAASVLLLLGIIGGGMTAREIVGKLSVQTFAGSIGAALARDQMGRHQVDDGGRKRTTYAQALFLMTAGAVFLGLNIAPTEEVALLAYKTTAASKLALVAVSMMLMHGFVYGLNFRGMPAPPEGATFWSLFIHYTVVGYAIALSVSLYMLWTFGSLDGTGMEEVLSAAVVLAFPCALGAAAFRLIL
ncbi:MAG: TIGR02587 family membrane protein [Hyphomicrobiales bacterium]